MLAKQDTQARLLSLHRHHKKRIVAAIEFLGVKQYLPLQKRGVF
jgi:hypothetical protein